MTLQVTNQASAQLKTLLDNTEHEPEQVIRLVSDPQGNASFTLDVEREGDQVVAHQGDTVMVIESAISEGLSGSTLDVRESPDGISFTLYRES